MQFKNDIFIDSNGCHVWKKSCSSSGYPQKTIKKKYWSLHRYVYFLKDRTLKSSDVVRHLCHNTKCINPDHLEKGSHKDNWNDSKEKHLMAQSKLRKVWEIKGVRYPTLREASKSTGIHQGTIIKYCIEGVFDYSSYLLGCSVANVTPRI
jgi:hypothetical protein